MLLLRLVPATGTVAIVQPSRENKYFNILAMSLVERAATVPGTGTSYYSSCQYYYY